MLADISGSGLKPVHREDRPGDIKNSLADISLATRHLDYRPRVRLREGLEKTFAWFRSSF
jgi:UDP-N-acetylglucosamine 4-epimerase